jgi:hypothetical protein
MDLAPCTFNPEYWVEEITSRLQLIIFWKKTKTIFDMGC